LKADPETADIPVILHTITDNRRLGYVLGAADYLLKPVAPERLIAALRKCQPAELAGPALVVEDDPATRDMLTSMLKKHFRSVREAADGRAALDRMAEAKPGLILLDLMMPRMDGFEFLAELHRNADWQAIPIVVLTAKEISPEECARLNGAVRRMVQKGACTAEDLARTVCELARASAAPSREEGDPWPC
jgi:CheY-like chemotaxis protein